MATPPGKQKRHRRYFACAYPEHPHRRWHHRCLCDRLRRLRAVRLLRPCARLHPSRHCCSCDLGRGFAARSGAGGARSRRRLRHAAARRFRQTELLGALSLSRHRHGCGFRARAHAPVALARRHRDCAQRIVDPAGDRQRAERRACAACAACCDQLCAGGRAHRLGLPVWPVRRAGPHRNRVVGRTGGLSLRRRTSWCWRPGTIRLPSSPSHCWFSRPSPLRGAAMRRSRPFPLRQLLVASGHVALGGAVRFQHAGRAQYRDFWSDGGSKPRTDRLSRCTWRGLCRAVRRGRVSLPRRERPRRSLRCYGPSRRLPRRSSS